MAGRGPIPKPAGQRARRNHDPVPAVTFHAEPARQPRLPARPDGAPWPRRTREWWRTWASTPQAQRFAATDWDFLVDTAVLHALFWEGHVAVAAELRLRLAKMGATPEDRARLRITLADADPPRPAAPSGSARERYGALHALPPVTGGEP